MRKVTKQIELIAYAKVASHIDGSPILSILEIVETSYRNAHHFTTRWLRDPEV